ncbi:RNA polymerase sigma factor [Phragmitibacter flavus]|nr:RNA polymerase sigma factor [Phragmitibacter flavus]
MEFSVDQGEDVRLAVPSMDSKVDFQQLVDGHYAALYRFAFSMCRAEAQAKDLVQQTFLLWARKGHALKDATKVKTWLFTTLYREWLAVARREKRFESVEFEPERHEAVDEPAAEPVEVDGAMLQRALDELAVGYRAPLVLFYLKELSYKEIAEALDIPVGTVMSRLSRGKGLLRDILNRTQNVTTSRGAVE